MTNLLKHINGLPYSTTEDMYKYYKKNLKKIISSNKNRYRLHPDNIDNGKFWELLEKKFGVDPVCPKVNTKEDANSRNHNLFANLGGYSAIITAERLSKNSKLNVLDVGAGYNFVYEDIFQYRPQWSYYGLDVHPKHDRVAKITDVYNLQGDLPDVKFDLIICSNVFQHLSEIVKISYCQQFFRLLGFNGILHLNPIYEARHKIYLYGQQTECLDWIELSRLTDGGFNRFSTSRQGTISGVSMIKKTIL